MPRPVATSTPVRDLNDLRALLKTTIHFNWRAQRDCMPLLRAAAEAGIDVHELADLAQRAATWSVFEQTVGERIAATDAARG